ncbi:DNA methyltransferase [Chloroflexus islandicus]|uniref:DNA methyltransferase n=1 Tax=Chloroflexus islandicus TaxID=1707952 RepID=A0A178MFU9_9CHLR|nr:DNA adenine methylase [Chloroflexus islandicus]OAN47611.1 DNA methyltransferase [Chloroflexus islandicus]
MTHPHQLDLFPDTPDGEQSRDRPTRLPQPVNVAAVPQRSPFRYPGGKTWFVPTFRRWMASLAQKPRILVEPFAGGGIISLTALFEHWVERVVMVELDEDVAAVWQTIVSGEAEWLAERILSFQLSRETLIAELSRPPASLRERAFHTILRNRTLHGGILADGASFLKHGENGKGIASRWYPQTLARRLRDLQQVAHRIDIRCADGMAVIEEFARCTDAVFFVDPPYTAGGKRAGKRLYRYHQIDHRRLFHLCRQVAGEVLLTYDEAEEVKELAREYGFQMRLVPMKNTHHATLRELVIGRDLAWLAELPVMREERGIYHV